MRGCSGFLHTAGSVRHPASDAVKYLRAAAVRVLAVHATSICAVLQARHSQTSRPHTEIFPATTYPICAKSCMRVPGFLMHGALAHRRCFRVHIHTIKIDSC